MKKVLLILTLFCVITIIVITDKVTFGDITFKSINNFTDKRGFYSSKIPSNYFFANTDREIMSNNKKYQIYGNEFTNVNNEKEKFIVEMSDIKMSAIDKNSVEEWALQVGLIKDDTKVDSYVNKYNVKFDTYLNNDEKNKEIKNITFVASLNSDKVVSVFANNFDKKNGNFSAVMEFVRNFQILK